MLRRGFVACPPERGAGSGGDCSFSHFRSAAYGGVTQWGASAQVKLSESSHQAAYPAGLGPHRVSTVRLTRRVASAGAGCRATSPVGSRRNAYAALVNQTAVIRRTPNAHSSVVTELGPVDVNGLPQVLGVIGVHSNARCAADWYRVQLAVVPNGTVGWVRAWAVRTFQVRSRIVIDLSERSLRLYRSGKLILETPVAVGASATPTPSGRYFVNERYELPDSRGPFGPAALGISAAFERPSARLGPGRADRHSRHERAMVDRSGCVTRLHSRREHA